MPGSQLGIYCKQGVLIIDKLIPAGKKEMPASAFLAGYRI
jgi:methionyl-tRNA formyltransferase